MTTLQTASYPWWIAAASPIDHDAYRRIAQTAIAREDCCARTWSDRMPDFEAFFHGKDSRQFLGFRSRDDAELIARTAAVEVFPLAELERHVLGNTQAAIALLAERNRLKIRLRCYHIIAAGGLVLWVAAAILR